MWVLKCTLRHECMISSRTKKFSITAQSYPLNEQQQSKEKLTTSLHFLHGEKEAIAEFAADLKKDKKVKYVEANNNMIYLIDIQKNKPVMETNRFIFFVKPTVSDSDGFEHWEIASHTKEILMNWMKTIKPHIKSFTLESISPLAISHIYLPRLLPGFTDLQKKAIDLASSEGYYAIPRKITIRKLAKIFCVSPSTYQKHLQAAEAKLIPELL
jgi:predicted DNA binding protein